MDRVFPRHHGSDWTEQIKEDPRELMALEQVGGAASKSKKAVDRSIYALREMSFSKTKLGVDRVWGHYPCSRRVKYLP
jgi:hypothetical protein